MTVPQTPEEALEVARLAVERALEVGDTAVAGSELVLGTDSALATKARLGSAYSEIEKHRRSAVEATTRAKEMIEAKRRELESMERDLKAQLEPLVKKAARLQDGIVTVNLYLGRDEELVELRDGASAPATEPLVIRQLVLAMDEESLLFAEGDKAPFDYEDVEAFNEWLLADPANLQQVLPDQKGVVAIQARKTTLDYTGNPVADDSKNKANLRTRWLLRNGERLYYMVTDFSVGEYLVPKRRDFTRLFEDGKGEPLVPGSREWLKAEEANDLLTRHYMKVAMILQGLVDRTAVFHPLPEGGLGLLGDRDYDEGKVILVEDDERAITTLRQPFDEWHRERIALLAVGQRVVGYFPSSNGSGDYRESNVTPRYAPSPSSDQVYTISRQDGSHFYFSYARTDTVDDYDNWGNYRGQRAPKTKASYRLAKSFYDAAWIPVDNVSVEEMQEYLDARTERKHYKTMFPALKAAIAFKLAEEELETPFRALLAHRLQIHDDEVKELVTWWKTSNKWHRALNGAPEHERRAASMIIKEHERRHKPVSRAAREALQAVPGAIVLAKRTNDLLAVVPSPRRYPAKSVPHDLYVDLHVFTPTGKLREVKRWQTLTRAQVAKWTLLGEHESWAGWKLNVPTGYHLTDDAIDSVLEEFKSWASAKKDGEPLVLVKYEETDNRAPKIEGYFPSRRGDASWRVDFEQPFISAYVTITRGVGSFDRSQGWLRSRDWRIDYSRNVGGDGTWASFPDRQSPQVPVPPHQTRYYGEIDGAIVYKDDELLKADLVAAAAWADEVLADRKRSGRIESVASMIRRAWDAHELEERRARFIEDFGDPDLWEDHAKSQTPKKFPTSEHPLRELGTLVVDQGVDVAGKTVGDVVAEVRAILPDLDAALLPLRFPGREVD